MAYVDVRVFAHATEDLDRVLTAVKNTLPSEIVETVTFRKTVLSGHHGNPITLVDARLKNRKAAQVFLEGLSARLSVLDKSFLSTELQQHLEKGNLYIRLDKQLAYLNELRLSSVDPIRFCVHFRRHSTEQVMEILREFGLLS